MPIPLLALAAGAGLAGTGFKLGGRINELYRGYQYNQENDRFWSDYRRNTGMSPKYPYRQGAKTDWIGWGMHAGKFGADTVGYAAGAKHGRAMRQMYG